MLFYLLSYPMLNMGFVLWAFFGLSKIVRLRKADWISLLSLIATSIMDIGQLPFIFIVSMQQAFLAATLFQPN